MINDLAQVKKVEKPIKENKKYFQTLQTIILSSAHAMHDTYSGFIAPLIPILILQLGLLKIQAGLFSFVYQIFAILQPFIGLAADKKNLRLFALIAPATTGIAMSLLGVAPNLSIALILCGLGGISSAILHAVLPPIVSNFSGDQIGKGMSFWMVGGQLGVMLGPILITSVVAAFSVKATPWLMIPGIVIAISLNILLKDVSTKNAKEEAHDKKISKTGLRTVMLPLGLIILTRSLLRSSSISFLPVFLSESGFSIWMVGLAVTLFKGSGIFGTILSGFISDHLGIRWIFTISLVISILAMIIFTNSIGIIQFVALTLIGASFMMELPVGMAIVQNYFPDNRSLANGIYLALSFAINAIADVILGALYDRFGGQHAFMIGAAVALLGIPFAFLLPKNGKPEVLAEEIRFD